LNPTYIARSTAVAARRLGDEMIVMSALDSTLFTLSGVAAIIWQAADGRTPLDEIVRERVCTAFAVDAETALHDAEDFVSALAGHGVLLVSTQPIATPAAQAAATSTTGELR
jgi:hypothetical protein